MSERPRRGNGPLGPLLALALVLALAVGGYWLFPIVQAALYRQDCLASGRVTGC